MSDQIQGQMSIFDFSQYLPASGCDDLERMTLEEVRERIEQATGLQFTVLEYLGDNGYYEARPKKGVRVSIGLSRFSCAGKMHMEGQRFISTNIDARNAGMGSPCISIQEAVECIRRNLPRYLEEVRA